MAKEMLINVSEGEECRIELLENGKLEELYMERTSSTSHVGNIYKGRVTNVEASIQAAFVDFGLGRNGFLHISDLLPSYFGRKGEDVQEQVGRKMARRDRPPIQRCLRRGDEIIVQIIKEGIGTKGPTLTTYLSIPGRILVMMPGMVSKGVSRKIEDEVERRRLRQILDSLEPIEEAGFIIRTAGVGKTKAEIQRDLQYLQRLWANIEKKRKSTPAPVELYTEGDLITRTVRDVFTSDVDSIIVDNKDVAKRIKEFIKITAPRTKNKVDLFDEPIPLFHKYGIEREIELMYSRHVPLPSGGSLVIDSTEAIVAIDVNSGKFRDHSDAETTAFKTDMEAADEIPRQLRLRDLGGVIICDFIDLRFERHRRQLEDRLHENLKNDRAKTKVLRMSQFGIIEMTRQRMRPSLKRSIYFDCPHCHGSGLVKTPESMSLDVMRRLAIAINDQRVSRVELAVSPEVSFYLNNRKRTQLTDLENKSGKKIVVRADNSLGLDDLRLELFDGREGLVFLDALDMKPQEPADGGRPQPQSRRGDRRDRYAQSQRQGRDRGGRDRGGRDRGRGRGRDQDRDQREPESEDRYDIERVEDDIEDRHEQHIAASSLDEAPAPMEGETSSERPAVSQETETPSEISETSETYGDGADVSETNAVESTSTEADVEQVPQEEEEPIELQPPNISHESPKLQPQNRGGGRRRDGRGGRGRDGGVRRGGGGGGHRNDQRQQNYRQPYGNVPDPRQIQRQPTLAEQLRDQVIKSEARPPQPQQPPPRQPQHQPPRPQQPLQQQQPQTGDQQQEGGGRRRRRRRGGRGRRRGGGGGQDSNQNQADTNGQQVSERAPHQPAPKPAPAPTTDYSAPVAVPAVARTGSTDRHLVREDSLHHSEPPRRPRTYRDLDAIPDDLD